MKQNRRGTWSRIKSACADLIDAAKLERIFNTENNRLTLYGGDGGNTSGYDISVGGVMQVSAASACVRLISETLSTLPFYLVREQPDGSKKRATDHPLYPLLKVSPNSKMTAVSFWQAFIAHQLLRGNSYVEIRRNVSDEVSSLMLLNPDRVTPKLDEAHNITAWRYTDPAGRTREIPLRSMWHTPAFTLDGIMGLSPLTYGAATLGGAAEVERSARSTFRNGMKTSGVLAVGGFNKLNNEQRLTLEQELQRKSAAGRPLILDADTKWETMTFSPQDAQLLASRAFSVEDVCRFFGVPPFLVGHSEKSTSWGTGIEQQTIGFVQFVLRRYAVRIEQSADMHLLSPVERLSMSTRFALDGLMRGDSAARAAFYQQMHSGGLMTADECRALEDLPPMGGNAAKLIVQGAMLPLDAIGAETAGAAAADAKSWALQWLGLDTTRETA